MVPRNRFICSAPSERFPIFFLQREQGMRDYEMAYGLLTTRLRRTLVRARERPQRGIAPDPSGCVASTTAAAAGVRRDGLGQVPAPAQQEEVRRLVAEVRTAVAASELTADVTGEVVPSIAPSSPI
jgi:hypothetical protein